MWWWRGGVVAALGIALAACSTTRPVTPPVVEGRQEGVASWYGPGFHGKRTANGEIYDQYELTAAHQTLPLGTRVMVTSLTNGRSVEVRINDRGPFVGGRIVDLSYAAASVIRMVGPGTMPVRVEVLDAPVQVASRTTVPVTTTPPASRRSFEPTARDVEPRPAPTIARGVPAEPAGSYAVLVATLSDARMAEHLRSRIAIKFDDAHVSPLDAGVGRYYRVRIGPYPSRGVAVAQAALVNRYGYPAVITDESRP
jgi:rare lipoprotein A